jgi:murein tripeptide amidase MpaA
MATALLLALRLPSSRAFVSSNQVCHRQGRGLNNASLSSSARISISDAYDGGNIQFIETETQEEGDKSIVKLNIKPDPFTELEEKSHFQYFSFRSTVSVGAGAGGGANNHHQVEYVIGNAGAASFAQAWDESTVFFSTSINDPDSWRRKLDTTYKDGKLSWSHQHDEASATSGGVYFSYFPPYSYSRHLDLIEKCAKCDDVHVESLGQSLDGREIEMVRVGTGNRTCWIIHRQHPGEHMAEFYAEGLLTRLLGLDSNGDVDGQVRKILGMYTFYIVPNMNPDGAVRGYLRTNAAGANLNREWASSSKGDDDYAAPTMERSPEVYAVLEKMTDTGCDVFLDIHGDEGLPYNFLAEPAVPNWGPRLQSLHGAFLGAYQRSNPDMQQKYGYEPSDEPSEVLNIANDQVAHRFDCLSITLEMPFKDCWSYLDPERGWSPARSRKLGASVLDPLVHVHPYLRADGEFWKDFPPQDTYVRPTSNYK